MEMFKSRGCRPLPLRSPAQDSERSATRADMVCLALLSCASLFFAAGCPDSIPPGACNTAADCPIAGHACINGTCQQVTAICSGDGDCAYGERCVAGNCERDENVCLRDADCDSGYRCEVLSGRCVLESCQRDADCEADFVCDNGECKPPQQSFCVADSECEPPSTICVGGSCTAGCSSTGCPNGFVCDTGTGRCLADDSCTLDDDCNPPSTVCDDNSCVPGCQSSSCPLENYCDIRTGRCIEGCTADSHCGAPTKICQGGTCADGCGATGCPGGFACDPMTGRCIPEDGCGADVDCGPPAMICESTECVAGCQTTGCEYEHHCSQTTGRCLAGCAGDGDCNPPATVCIGTSCLPPPDCLQDGCSGSDMCDFESRLCEPRGTAALGQSCNDGSGGAEHTACASDYCIPLVLPPEGPGPTCSTPCTTMDNCPTGFGCLGLNPSGANVCLAWSQTAAPGATCSSNDGCRSGLCHNGVCQRICQHDRECTGGQVCGIVIGADYMVTACIDPAGAGNTGSSCSSLADCRRYICLGSQCADPCHISEDCPLGFVCDFVTNGTDWVRACVWPTWAGGASPGTGAAGSVCDPSTHLPCRSLWCVDFEEGTGQGRCVDVCANQSNCPVGFRCSVIVLGEGEGAHTAPLCLPR